MPERSIVDLLPVPWNPESLRSLPRRPEDSWECACFRLPAWIRDEKTGGYYRPDAVIWASGTDGYRVVPLPHGGEPSTGVLDSLQAAITGVEGFSRLPGSIAVTAPDLAEALGDVLVRMGIRVKVKDELPLAEVAAIMLRGELYKNTGSEPGYLEGKGVDFGRVRAFADAAVQY